jgi:hypothetical protein
MFNADLDQNIRLKIMYLPQGRHIVVIFNLYFELMTLQGASTCSEVINDGNHNANNYQP